MGEDITTISWQSLTRMPRKSELYDRETHFREGWRHVVSVFGGETEEFLRRSALIMVKPDGIVSGKLAPVHGFLAENGFSVVGVEQPVFSRLMWREMWRYQLTAATDDRLAVNELVMVGTCLLLLIHDEQAGELPATVRLASLKGSADLSKQLPGTLRARLGQPNRILSHIHVADEPADLVRELSLLLEPEEREHALRSFKRGVVSIADQAILDEALVAESTTVSRKFDAGESFRSVVETLKNTVVSDPEVSARNHRTIAELERARAGEQVEWPGLAAALLASGAELDRWDLAMIGANLIVADEPGQAKVIPNPDLALWMEERG